jgi:predicted TIM-barrel fold metal-dependent hydrolase
MTSHPQRIDVHHHFLPPAFLADLKRRGVHWTGGSPPVPGWDVPLAREMMERNGIAVAVASVIPQVDWGDAAAATICARMSNEYSARVVHDDPEHFGAFATLPLPYVADAVRELEYALDVLKLDGVILFASQGVQYLGDPSYEEVFQELERRKAIVFIHPNTVPPGSIVPKISLPWGLVDFPLDTSRAVANLLFTGVLERYPSIRYIVSHAGGAIPYLALRLALGEHLPTWPKENAPKGVLHYLKRLYYDTALSTSEQVFAALREFAPASHVLFGSDYPMVPEKVATIETQMIEASKVLDAETRPAINRDNALALFPRFVQKADARATAASRAVG